MILNLNKIRRQGPYCDPSFFAGDVVLEYEETEPVDDPRKFRGVPDLRETLSFNPIELRRPGSRATVKVTTQERRGNGIEVSEKGPSQPHTPSAEVPTP